MCSMCSSAVEHNSPYKNVSVQSNRTAYSLPNIRLFKAVTRLNPVFQPILTGAIVTVNMGWNTGFSIVTHLNKGCSLLTVLKPNVCSGVCSSVRLDTDIFIGTSVLNCQTIKTLFLLILVIKTIFSRKFQVRGQDGTRIRQLLGPWFGIKLAGYFFP